MIENYLKFVGVAHADELSYMFYFDYMKKDRAENEKAPSEGSKNRLVVERFIRMWCNFATTGLVIFLFFNIL